MGGGWFPKRPFLHACLCATGRRQNYDAAAALVWFCARTAAIAGQDGGDMTPGYYARYSTRHDGAVYGRAAVVRITSPAGRHREQTFVAQTFCAPYRHAAALAANDGCAAYAARTRGHCLPLGLSYLSYMTQSQSNLWLSPLMSLWRPGDSATL